MKNLAFAIGKWHNQGEQEKKEKDARTACATSRQNNANRNIRKNQIDPRKPETMKDQHLFLPQHGHYRHLRVYRVAEALYDLTYIFCKRFLPSRGDRTVDQMVQAARSGKQNIAEGNQAAATSAETEIKLTNVARASIEELIADYEDYLRTRSLPKWDVGHPRMGPLRQWTRSEDFFAHCKENAGHMTAEEMANLCLTLCHQAVYMLGQLLKTQQTRFVEQGGIKERMHRARTGYRNARDAELAALRQENTALRQRVAQLERELGERGETSSRNNLSNQSNQIGAPPPSNSGNQQQP